ncbi:MAG: hypothetical protein U0350_48410 [Caldilineaceae bacterium]
MAPMTQERQSLKTEITSALDFLALDSLRLLFKFVIFLRSNTAQPEISKVEPLIDLESPHSVVRIPSPRLVHRHQIADFQKEIIENI